jgi:hypothetical protein
MAKGPHREAQRVVLPNGMWILLYADGSLKLAGYDQALTVTEVQNRDGGAQVFLSVRPTSESPRTIRPLPNDLVTVERRVMDALHRAAER